MIFSKKIEIFIITARWPEEERMSGSLLRHKENREEWNIEKRSKRMWFYMEIY